MPDRLHLDERLDHPWRFHEFLVVPPLVGALIGGFVGDLADADAFEVLGGAHAERLGLVGWEVAGVDRVDAPMAPDPGDELGAVAGQDVEHARRDIGSVGDLGEEARDDRRSASREGDDGVARTERRRDERDEGEQRRRIGRDDGDDARRLGHGEVVVRARDGVPAAEDLLVLVAPPGVGDEAIDGRCELALGLALGRGAREFFDELGAARFEHLRKAIEDLGAVVGVAPGPAWLGGLGGADGIAQVLAGCLAQVGAGLPSVVADDEGPAGLRADELAAHVQLVRLGDVEACHGGIVAVTAVALSGLPPRAPRLADPSKRTDRGNGYCTGLLTGDAEGGEQRIEVDRVHDAVAVGVSCTAARLAAEVGEQDVQIGGVDECVSVQVGDAVDRAEFLGDGVAPEADVASIGVGDPCFDILFDVGGPAVEDLCGGADESLELVDVPGPRGRLFFGEVAVDAVGAGRDRGEDDLVGRAVGVVDERAGVGDVVGVGEDEDVGVVVDWRDLAHEEADGVAPAC